MHKSANKMIIPVRCFTCGKIIADKWEKYISIVDTEEQRRAGPAQPERSPEFVAMEQLHITRMCCRRHFLTNIDIVDQI